MYIIQSNMIRSAENRREEKARPFCQATGCFDQADVYLVIKETEVSDYYEAKAENSYQKTQSEVLDFDGFKLILYLCGRHDEDDASSFRARRDLDGVGRQSEACARLRDRHALRR